MVGERPADPDKVQYVLIDLTPGTLSRVRQEPPLTLGGYFRSTSGPPDLKLGVGDTVSVTIFEAASGGLFIPSEAGARAGNFVALPVQEVARDGEITYLLDRPNTPPIPRPERDVLIALLKFALEKLGEGVVDRA